VESCSDAQLVSRARGGDAPAFVTLCERHRSRIWRIVVSVTGGPEAEDLAQETVIRAYRALDSYLGEAPFGAWICRIALNVAHDYRRSAWTRRVLLFDRLPPCPADPAETPHARAELQDLQLRVRRAVGNLPPKQAVPIWLHYFEGCSLAAVARLEQLPEATVRSRVQAGLRRLARSLGDVLGLAPESPVPLTRQQEGCTP